MTHLGTVTLDTPRLTLRRFTLADAGPMLHNWAGDEEVTRYLTWPAHPDEAASRAVLASWLQAYAHPKTYLWAMELKQLGQPIGSISAVKVEDDLGLVQIGYCTGRPWWRQGFTSEALAAVLPFFFDRVGANRVEAWHDPRNEHSGQVMRKCGLVYEGTLRQAGRNNQGLCDCAYYGLLASAWAARKP